MINLFRLFLLILVTISLASCSFFSPVKTDAEKIYVLNCIPTVPCKPHTNKTLLVSMPETSSIYDTNEIAYSLQPHQLSYYAKSRWADTPANMLYPSIIEAIQNTHHFHAVVGASFTGLTTYVLHTKIIKLERTYYCCPSTVSLVVRANLIDAATRTVIASRKFCITEIAPENTPYGAVLAANRASAILLINLANFVSSY